MAVNFAGEARRKKDKILKLAECWSSKKKKREKGE